jgi:photosystem II stability/assembly factor-like uncharacterized protein
MAVLAATMDGVYRFPDVPFEDPELVLADVDALELKTFDGVEGAWAATKQGLYRSVDGGDTWERTGVPMERVPTVAASPGGEYVYAGTNPGAVFRSGDVGDTWIELAGFQEVDRRGEWPMVPHRALARVRGMDVPDDDPDTIVTGIEAAGVVYSMDGGETWTACYEGLDVDVHDVHALSAEEWIVPTRSGPFVTEDGGDSWRRVETARRYHREVLLHDGVAYAAGAAESPAFFETGDERGADAELYVSRDGFEAWETVDYPGYPESYVMSWLAYSDGSVLGGANDGGIYRSADGGETWETVGAVPVVEEMKAAYGVTSMVEV